MNEYNPVKIYNRNILLLLIPIIGAAISLLYFINPQNVQDHIRIVFVLHSVIITSGLWLGCNTIVIFLWKQFPWEFYPIKHVIFITAYDKYALRAFELQSIDYLLTYHVRSIASCYQHIKTNDRYSELLLFAKNIRTIQ
jgi:DNA-binding LytR/AlgR family response regulator